MGGFFRNDRLPRGYLFVLQKKNLSALAREALAVVHQMTLCFAQTCYAQRPTPSKQQVQQPTVLIGNPSHRSLISRVLIGKAPGLVLIEHGDKILAKRYRSCLGIGMVQLDIVECSWKHDMTRCHVHHDAFKSSLSDRKVIFKKDTRFMTRFFSLDKWQYQLLHHVSYQQTAVWLYDLGSCFFPDCAVFSISILFPGTSFHSHAMHRRSQLPELPEN